MGYYLKFPQVCEWQQKELGLFFFPLLIQGYFTWFICRQKYTKVLLNLHCKVSLYFQISVYMRFLESYWVQVPMKMNLSLWFSVYISGTNHGKWTCGITCKHNYTKTSCSVKLLIKSVVKILENACKFLTNIPLP